MILTNEPSCKYCSTHSTLFSKKLGSHHEKVGTSLLILIDFFASFPQKTLERNKYKLSFDYKVWTHASNHNRISLLFLI